MLTFLRNHPFAVDAYFERSLVLTYAVPADLLQEKLPPVLSIDRFEDNWGFIAVALVQTKNLRPAGFPKWMGSNFFLIGYRLFVRYKTRNGKSLRGLYILRSQTDSRQMKMMGNLFTHYNYSRIDVTQSIGDTTETIESKQGDLRIQIDSSGQNVDLPVSSPFHSWKEARRFAGPLPFTFTYQPKEKSVLIIEGVRENWTPEPVKVNQHQVGFLDELNLTSLTLANAFAVRGIPYRWKKGIKDFPA